jgi:hypothetical protein
MSLNLRQLSLLLCCLLGFGHAGYAHAREALPEYTLKAAYLYKFALLTEWPADTLGNNINLCFMADEDFGRALDSINGKQINNRPINTRPIVSAEETGSCNIIFIGQMTHTNLTNLISKIATQPILTVTDDEQMAKAGASIFLRPEGQRLVFEINAEAAQSAKLKISSRLLRLAK